MNQRCTLLTAVRTFLARVGTGAGVVAVSGGPDSVALLCALAALRVEGLCGQLIVSHLNHHLRGSESDADEAFVHDLHARLAASDPVGYLWRSTRLDVAGQAQAQGENLESVARQLRYDWLASLALETGAAWVATGHTADDQAETVLHRLLRGTGLKGLGGIPARRPLTPGVEVIRPLLTVRRQDVLAFLQEIGQDYRRDSSNADLRYTRNRIRHELLPHLAEHYNSAIMELLCRLAAQAAEAQQGEEDAAAVLLREAELPRAGNLLVFDGHRLSEVSRHLVRAMFRLVWAREGWPLRGMGYQEWDRTAAVALGEESAVDLPDGVRLRRRERVVQIGLH